MGRPGAASSVFASADFKLLRRAAAAADLGTGSSSDGQALGAYVYLRGPPTLF